MKEHLRAVIEQNAFIGMIASRKRMRHCHRRRSGNNNMLSLTMPEERKEKTSPSRGGGGGGRLFERGCWSRVRTHFARRKFSSEIYGVNTCCGQTAE